MKQLAAICVKRPVFATVLMLVLVVFGVNSFMKLGLDRFPKIEFPFVTVTTVLPGSAPEDIETEITDKIEGAVNTISGIEELRSISSEGVSMVIVQFELEKDLDVAAQDVRDKINGVMPELPSDIEQPTIQKIDPDASPIITIAVSAPPPATLRDITEYCDKVLRRRLENVSGIGQVMIIGGQKRQINVNLDPLKLRAYKLTVADVARALRTQNMQVPSGSMKVGGKEYTLRTLGRVKDMREMEAITVDNRDHRTITIGDLGHAEDSTEELESASLLNDSPCVQLNIRKQSGTNTVAVADAFKERLEELKSTMPPGYDVQIVRDQSVFIEASVHAVEEHMLLGGLLAAIVVFLFLANFRATIIAALSIPTSIIAAFAIIYYMGFTLNSMSLLALTLSVGIVIDDAIVVMENIFRYIEEKGYTPREAATAATGEIAMAVLAITLSLVAVFLPVAMMEGIVGRFLSVFGITMAATIVVSMLVSFTLTPMLAARWFKKAQEKKEGKHSSGSKGQFFYHAIETAYMSALRFSLRWRFVVVLLMIGSLATIPYLFKVLPKDFMPTDDSSEFQVNVHAPEGTSLEATQLIIARIAREVRNFDGVKYTITNVADTEQKNAHKGSAYARLVDIADRDFSQASIIDRVREEVLPKHELYKGQKVRLSVTPVSLFSMGGVNSDVMYMISGPDMDVLEESANAVMADLKKVPGAEDVDSSLSVGKPQYGIRVDRPKAAELGVSIADITSTLQLLVAGDKVSDYNEHGEQYEVHVRSIANVRNNLDELKMVTVPSSKYGTIPLDDVVNFDPGAGPAEINRLNRARQVTISCNMLEGTSQQAIIDAINASVAKLDLGPEYMTGLLGKSKEMARAFRAFGVAFLLAFIFIYLCLAAQFESWLHPLTILLSLPLTLPFALVSLWIFGQSINIFSLLGIMVLFAVVKKNSILQIDHANQLRAGGMPRTEAILTANRDRLRPILMTTVAFVAGMVPLFFSNAEGSAVNKAVSGVIIGGQTLSLLLTLLAIPVAYSLFDDLSIFFWRMFGKKNKESAEELKPISIADPDSPAGNGDTIISEQPNETLVVRRESSHSPDEEFTIHHP